MENGLHKFYDDYTNHLYSLLYNSDGKIDSQGTAITLTYLYVYFYIYYFGIISATSEFIIEMMSKHVNQRKWIPNCPLSLLRFNYSKIRKM